MPPNWMLWIVKQIATLSLVAILAGCASALQIHTPTPSGAPAVGFTLAGTVERGQLFTQNLRPHLTFQLLPLAEDWEIWVGDPTLSTERTHNFAMPVTPPFVGVNARQIEGWHFRNLDNSGPNEAGAKNVNAPQELRYFCFVGNGESFQMALNAFAKGVPALHDAVTNHALPLHSGTLTVTDYTVGNLIPNQRAWLEQISFTVTLNLDQPCDLFEPFSVRLLHGQSQKASFPCKRPLQNSVG